MVNRMANLADHKQIVLAQEIIHIIDAAGLRVLDWNQAILCLACCHGPEDIGETAIGNGAWLYALFSRELCAEISACCLVAKSPALALESNAQCCPGR